MILTLFLVFFAFLIMGMGALGSYTYYKKKKDKGFPDGGVFSYNPEYIDTVSARFVWQLFILQICSV